MTLPLENKQVRYLVPVRCQLGESPVWDSFRGVLYWVDILGCTLYRFDPRSQALQSWTTPEMVGFVVVTEREHVLMAGLKSGLHHLTLKAGGGLDARRIDRVDDYREYIRFNDGCTDARGNVWG